MSASHLAEWPLASADGLLTNEECYLLLDADILAADEADDLLKSFPSVAPKIETIGYPSDEPSTLYPPSPPEVKPSRAELANDLLQQLETQYKQENIFSNWLEEKVELPIFENIPQVAERVEPPPPVTQFAPPHTEELLREFETVYGAVELTHLTPPQSPPGPATQLLLSYAQQASCAPLAPLAEPWPADYDNSVEAVDELVRFRAAQFTSPPSSPPRSSSSHSSTDEEWSARPKPYARSDERRFRKKEQNKNAATRYRQKKKAEVEILLSEEQTLRQRNANLTDKCAEVQREVRYIKGLMRELFKAKGLIK